VKRLLAFVLAAAMVAGSLYLRSRMDDDGDDGGGPVTADSARIVCSTALAAACDALGGTTEDAGRTAERLVAADEADLDVWIVPAPWPQLVDIRRDQEGREPVFGDADPVTTTRLAMVAWSDALPCAADPSWACVADATAGGVQPGHADPTRDDVGLLVLGHVAASLLGRTDLSTIDLEDPVFDDAFNRLEHAVPEFDDDPLTRMLVQGPSAFDVVALTDADARRILATAARRNEVQVLYPSPMATAGAVVAARRGARLPESVRSDAAAALVAAGWTRGGRTAGLPDAGFLDAVVERWEQVAG
jgi:hypothetical protein